MMRSDSCVNALPYVSSAERLLSTFKPEFSRRPSSPGAVPGGEKTGQEGLRGRSGAQQDHQLQLLQRVFAVFAQQTASGLIVARLDTDNLIGVDWLVEQL